MKTPNMPSDGLLLSDRKRSKMLLKLEMPVLINDHSKDMRWFRRPLDLQKLLTACAEAYSLQAPKGDGMPDVLDQCRTAADGV